MDKPPYRPFGVAVTTHVKEMFMEQRQQFQVMVLQLVPSRGAILLTVTKKVGKMPSREANQLTMDSRGTVHGWVLTVALFCAIKLN